MSIAATLSKLPAKSINEILEHLNRTRTQAIARGEPRESVPLPIVSLMLHTGATLRGEILSYAQERNQNPMLMLQTNVGASAADVSYIPVAAISGLTLHLNRDNIHLVAFGSMNPLAPHGKGPGRLEVERHLAEWTASFAKSSGVELAIEVDWESVPAQDQARFTLFQMIRAFEGVLGELSTDSLGKDALKESARRIRVTRGDEPGFAKKDGALLVTFAADGEDIHVVPSSSMKAALEKAL